MSQYIASVPDDGTLKPGIASFFENFYAISDTPTGHELYADQFTGDATLIMASKAAKGRQGEFRNISRYIGFLLTDFVRDH